MPIYSTWCWGCAKPTTLCTCVTGIDPTYVPTVGTTTIGFCSKCSCQPCICGGTADPTYVPSFTLPHFCSVCNCQPCNCYTDPTVMTTPVFCWGCAKQPCVCNQWKLSIGEDEDEEEPPTLGEVVGDFIDGIISWWTRTP